MLTENQENKITDHQGRDTGRQHECFFSWGATAMLAEIQEKVTAL